MAENSLAQQPFQTPFFNHLAHMTREELLEQTYEFRMPNSESPTGYDLHRGQASLIFRGFRGVEAVPTTTFLMKSPTLSQTVFVEQKDITGIQVKSIGDIDKREVYTNVMLHTACYFTTRAGKLLHKCPVESINLLRQTLEFSTKEGTVEIGFDKIDWMCQTDQTPVSQN